METEQKSKPIKSLCLYNDMYHVWVIMGSRTTLDINVSDTVANVNYNAAEFDGLRYHIKNERIFNDVIIRAMKEKPSLVKQLFQFYRDETAHPDSLADLKIKFDCFKRRVNIYVHKKAKKTKQLLWD
mgnify:CR=1 FL=1